MSMQVKTMAVAAAVLLASAAAVAAEMPRSEWHPQVSACSQDAAALAKTIAQLSAADQCAFLAEVNEAIAKMPGSDEVKAAKFYEANRAALQGASRVNRAAVLAEVFATVPPEYLTILNERFAVELFSRTSPSRPLSDAEFEARARNTMATIAARLKGVENAGVRETFAALLFIRASGGTPANLTDTLVAGMADAEARAKASGWIAAALGKNGQEKTYDPMLGFAQAGDEPDHAVVARLASGQQLGMAMLADLQSQNAKKGGTSKFASATTFHSTIVGTAGFGQSDIALNRVPRGYLGSKFPVGIGITRRSDGTYVDSHGNVVTPDGNGNFVDKDGNVISSDNPYYGKKRGGSGKEPWHYPGQE